MFWNTKDIWAAIEIDLMQVQLSMYMKKILIEFRTFKYEVKKDECWSEIVYCNETV